MLNKLTEWSSVQLSEEETVVRSFYQRQGWNVEVAPVIVQRMCCYDFYLTKQSKERIVEVKADSASLATGNFFIETLIIREGRHNSPGWYKKLPCHFPDTYQKSCPHLICWLYGDTILEVLSEELIELVESASWKERETKGKFRARGFIIPVQEIASLLNSTLYKLDA